MKIYAYGLVVFCFLVAIMLVQLSCAQSSKSDTCPHKELAYEVHLINGELGYHLYSTFYCDDVQAEGAVNCYSKDGTSFYKAIVFGAATVFLSDRECAK